VVSDSISLIMAMAHPMRLEPIRGGYNSLVILPWVAAAAYWIIEARTARTLKAHRRESAIPRAAILLMVVTGYVLLFSPITAVGVLGRRFLPAETYSDIAGVFVTWIGLALATISRYHLGRYWSARITVKTGHSIVQSGPYRWIRHPLYAGLLIAMAGTAWVFGQWRCVIGVALVACAHLIKAVREERLLSTEFGETYLRYRRRTGMLLPRFW
jgi:protein-S-isoprenylcysteine O-methyltransferase Ste14